MNSPASHIRQTEQGPQATYRIMVVDNNEIDRKFYTNELAKHFTVVLVHSSKEAWDLLNRAPIPDAIILDTLTCEDDGLTFCDRVKDNQFTRDIPVVFVSAMNNPSAKSQAFEIGGADFLSKPLVLPELVARIKRHVSIYRKTKRLEALIYIDPLTHLPNASKFKDVLNQEWSRCARYWHHLSLLLIRIDNMAQFKAQYGKDEYYALTASIADDMCSIGGRPGDLLASLGNDVFGLLLSDCSNNGAAIKANEIMQRFEKPHFAVNQQDDSNKITCTIGVAVAAPAGGGQAENLYQIADDLLFNAEQQGTGKIYTNENILGINNLNPDQS